MIVRTWTARASPEGADRYQQHFANAVLPKLSKLAGFQGAIVLRQDDGAEVKLTDLTFWDSLAAIEAFAGPSVTTAVVDEVAQGLLLEYDAFTTHSVVVVDAR